VDILDDMGVSTLSEVFLKVNHSFKAVIDVCSAKLYLGGLKWWLFSSATTR